MERTFLEELIAEIGVSTHVIACVIIALCASVVAYLNKVKNGQHFRLSGFLINSAVAVMVAFAIGSFLEYWGDIHSGLEKAVMVFVGISANKILELAETHGKKYLEKKAKNILDNH